MARIRPAIWLSIAAVVIVAAIVTTYFGMQHGKVPETSSVSTDDSKAVLQSLHFLQSFQRSGMTVDEQELLEQAFRGNMRNNTGRKIDPDSALTTVLSVASPQIRELFVDAKEGRLDEMTRWLEENKSQLNKSIGIMSGMSLLHYASILGQVNLVRELLSQEKYGLAVDSLDKSKNTPLHLASKAGIVDVVQLLIDKRANVTVSNSDHKTPLHEAAAGGYEAVVTLLLNHSADINASCTVRCQSALYFATEGGHTDVVKLLLKRCGYLEMNFDSECSPWIVSARKGYAAIVELLLHHGAKVNGTYRYYQGGTVYQSLHTALHYAAQNGHASVVEMLLDHDAYVNAKGILTKGYSRVSRTPLQYAAENGHEAVVRLLLDHNAAVNIKCPPQKQCKDKHGRARFCGPDCDLSPLHFAVRNENFTIAQLLLNHSANVNATDINRSTPLHFAAQNGNFKIARLLLNSGANVNTTDSNRDTSLHWSVRDGHYALTELLLNQGVDVNAYNDFFVLPLHIAVINGDYATVTLLLHYGADVNATWNNREMTALHYAAEKGHGAIVRLLLRSGANAKAKNWDGSTALHYSFYNTCSVDLVELLLDHGVDVNAMTSHAWTPLHSAVEQCSDNDTVVRLLLNSGADVNAKVGWKFARKTPLHFAAEKGFANIGKLLLEAVPTSTQQA